VSNPTCPDPACRSARTVTTSRQPRRSVGARAAILLATNGSPSARAATSLAADLAATFDAALRIIHVVAPIEYRVGRLTPTRPIERKLDCPYDNPVLLEARQLAWRRGAAATLQLVAGDPGRAIVSAAEHVDLLVIGGRDHHVPSCLRARTRGWVETHAGCPLLTCPHPDSPESRRELWPTLTGPHNPRVAPR
jgi:nucleotide-binding universal stress UspA family protein